MVGRIAKSLQDAAPEVLYAATEGHHLNIGPGEPAIGEWKALGLELPHLDSMRSYRKQRVLDQMNKMGYDGVIVMDPMNIRYITDTTNMQVWVMHNGARYAWLGADGHTIVWDYPNCEFLSGHSNVVDEVRQATGSTYFLAGPRYAEKAKAWGNEMLDVIRAQVGAGSARIAIDQCHHIGYQVLTEGGVEIGAGLTEKSGELIFYDGDTQKVAKWSHLCELFKAESGSLLKLSKLNETAVFPKPVERQNVSTCLKVFSEETVNALLNHSKTKNEPGCEETAHHQHSFELVEDCKLPCNGCKYSA